MSFVAGARLLGLTEERLDMAKRSRPSFRCIPAVLLAALIFLSPRAAGAERVTVDRVVRVTVTKADKSKLTGRVMSYDPTSFELLRAENDRVEVKWAELEPASVFETRSRLITKPEGPAWLAVGRDLRALPGCEKQAERAFANAVKADPKLKDAVDAARKAPIKIAAATAPANAEVQDPKAPWKPLTAEDQSKAILDLEGFAAETQKTMQLKLNRYETNFFLFYCDLPAAEAERWAKLLDRMYAKLSDLFGKDKGVNVWRGKALVFVFTKSADYQKFERLMHHTDAGGVLGMCHNFPAGEVHIAFYRQPNDTAFAHVLVHESVHGFLHRFKTPVSIPSWVNEGLAETIATQIVTPGVTDDDVAAVAKSAVENHGRSLGGMLDAKPIAEWQYPLAESLTRFLIRSERKRYVNFVIAIKDGMPWSDAMKEKIKVDRAALVKAYGEEGIKVKGLKE